jgi:ligand-binding sensor domain-containing protein
MRVVNVVATLLVTSAGLFAQSQSPSALGAREPLGTLVRPSPKAWREYTFDKSALHAEFDGTELWVGTVFGGVYRWDTTTGEHENFTRVNDGLLDNGVLDLAVHEGEVWVGHWFGLSHFDGREWVVYDQTTSPLKSAIAVEVVGDVTWVGTWDQGLFRFEGGTWTQFTKFNSGLSDNLVTSIAVDSSGDLWVGAWSGGVDRFDGTTWDNFSPANSGLISYFVWVRAAHPSDGRVWFYCHDDDFDPDVGIAVFDGVSNWELILPPGSGSGSSSFAGPTASQGIHSEYIHSVVVDAADAVWYEGSGAISRQEGSTWTLFDGITTGFDFNLPHGSAMAVSGTGELWAATGAGLLRYDGVDFVSHATTGLWDMDVAEIAVDETGTTWLATRAGVHGVKHGVWTRYTTQNSPLHQDWISTVAATPDGGLLAGGTQGGAAYVKGGQWTTWNTSSSGIHSDHILAAGASRSGAYWFGSGIYSAGAVSRFENGQWTVFTEQGSGLTDDAVTRIVADPYSDAVWFVSHRGADRFVNGTWTYFPIGAPAGDTCKDLAFAPNGDIWFARWQGATLLSRGLTFDFSSANGLAENHSNAIALDALGRVWVGHQDAGLSRLDGGAWTHLDHEDGLTSDRVFAIEITPNGTLWFGTGVNLGRYDPRHER